jgi:exosome complex protein LRP1
MPQGDNKDLKEKLSELISRERAKAAAKTSEKKRPAEGTSTTPSQAEESLPKRPKRNGSKKKK